MRNGSFENLPLFSVLAMLVVVKAVGLLAFGPVMTPDSYGYADFADIMLNSRDWLFYDNLQVYGYPATSFRSIGYPALIAVLKLVAGEAWSWVIVGLQFALSLVASAYIFRLVKRLSGHSGLALFAAFAHGAGQTFVLDQCILTDSFNASLLLILSCHVGLAVLDRCRPSLLEVGALGCLVLVAFLLREAGSYLQFLYWPLILYWGVCVCGGKLRPVLMVVVFAIPMGVGTQAYKAWNEERTGKRFITTAAQTGMFFPALELEKRGVPVLSRDALLSDMEPLGPWASTTPLQNVSRINAHLVGQHGFDAVDVARYGMATFLRYWVDYPLDMVKVTLSHFREKQAFLAFMPIEAGEQLGLWAIGKSPLPKKGELRSAVLEDGRVDQLALIVGRSVSRLVSALIAAAFLFGVPILFVRQMLQNRAKIREYDVGVTLMMIYWMAYFGYTFAYAMVSLEMRYLMPVEPLSMVIGVVLVFAGVHKFRQRRAVIGEV